MITMERHRYTDNKQLHHNVIKSLVSKSSRSFADDVSNDELEVRLHRRRRHHNHHNHHHRHHSHRHRHRHRHHNAQKITAYDDDDVPHIEDKMLEGDLEDISSELDEVDRQQQQQYHELSTEELELPHARSRKHLDSPSVISVSSSHSSLSNKNYSHSPAVVVDNESPHGHNYQPSSPGKLKLQKIRYSKRSQPPTPTSSAKRSRTGSSSRSPSRSSSRSPSRSRSRSQSLEASDYEASKSDTSRSSRLSSGNSSYSGESNHSRSSSSDSRTSTHSADKEEVLKEVDKVMNNNGAILEKNVSSTPEAAEQFGEISVKNKVDTKCNLPDYYPGVQGCRSVEEFQCLNRIEEGTYGVVYRAKDKKTNELVALKRLKMEKETEGFPITSLREINTLLKGQHPNIVTVREIVVGSNMDQIFIVMDYVEHDLKSLMQTMKTRKQTFLPSEVKCLTKQLLYAVAHLHDNWILHRDLKTSNLLLSHKGILKVADFGLAREYGSPLKRYTPVVVTLWYRAPELLLCSPEYSTPVDMWSVGCIFAEMIRMHPLFTGQTEIDQLNRIYKELGTPNEKIWPGYKDLPAVKNMLSQNSQFTEYPISNIKKRFASNTTEIGIDLLQGMLTYDPERRLSAEKALQHEYFKELPLPIDPSMFPTWPAKSELGERKKVASPKPPPGGTQFKQQQQQLEGLDGQYTKGAGFQLKF